MADDDKAIQLTAQELGAMIAAGGSVMQFSVAAAALGLAQASQFAILYALLEGLARELALDGDQVERILVRAADLIDDHLRSIEDACEPIGGPLTRETEGFATSLRHQGQRIALAGKREGIQ